MDCIKKFIQNNLTRKNIRKISFLLLPLLVQLFIFKSNDSQTYIPFVLIGAYFPLMYNYNVKTTRHYFMLGLSLLLRFVAIVIGLIFILVGKDYGQFNITIGIIYLVLAVIADNKMPYSLSGILLINALMYFFLNQNYVHFATGFVIFILIEFIFQSNLQLLAPFSKQTFGMEGIGKMSFSKGVTFTVLTTVLIAFTVGLIHLVEPFPKSYANQRLKYERQVAKKQMLEEESQRFVELLDEKMLDEINK
jgi:hypothetical protein